MHVLVFTAPSYRSDRSVDTIGGGTKSPKDTKPREARQPSMYVLLRVMDP